MTITAISTPTSTVDIEEQRAWLIDHKSATGMSWTEIAKRIGRSAGTLSQFGSTRGYGGDESGVAEEVARYRQSLASQSALSVATPNPPAFFAGPTAREIQSILSYAQRGRMAVIATGAGLGKTTSLRDYQSKFANVWVATMKPSTSSIAPMLQAVLKAIGEKDVNGPPNQLSARIVDKLARTGGLLAIDEAQHLKSTSLDELRALHDDTGIGIVLLGNIKVLSRLEGGSRSADFAQLYSRIGLRMIRPLPLQGDADALCDAWGLEQEDQRRAVRSICQKPGGLRGATLTLELAFMMAGSEGVAPTAGHIRDCWAQLSTRQIAA